MRSFGAELLGVQKNEIIVGGNSSLSLMYLSMLFAWQFGLSGPNSAWRNQKMLNFYVHLRVMIAIFLFVRNLVSRC